MADITKRTINGIEYTFINTSRGNRSGFVHETELYGGTAFLGRAKCQYYNRTWECYTYQSVMKNLVSGLMGEERETFERRWKEAHDVKRLTATKRAEMEQDFAENPPTAYANFKALYDSL